MIKETFRMPTVKEVYEMNLDIEDPMAVYKLAAFCINIPYEEFIEWPIDEALPVVDKVNKMMISGLPK